MYSVTWILGSGISKTCLVVILTGNISWRLEEQQGQISSLISTVKSGVSTFSKVCPLWLGWPPVYVNLKVYQYFTWKVYHYKISSS